MRFNPEFPSSGYNPRSVGLTAWNAKTARSKKQFIQWLNKNHPDLLSRAIRAANLQRSDLQLNGFGNVGDADDTPWYDRIMNAAEKIVPVWAGYEQQKRMIELNEKRAKQGLPPMQEPPTIRIQGEAGPETRHAVQAGIKEAAGQYMPLLIGGGVLLYLAMQK